MASHGSRGSSRGRAQVSSISKGRGGRHGGYPDGRRRGKPIFDSARLAQKEIESDQDIESDNEEVEQELGSESDSSDRDNEGVPYAALMQSISTESAPRSKRRKVKHDYASEPIGISEDMEGQSDIDSEDETEEPETTFEDLTNGEEDFSEDRTDPFRVHYAEPEEDLVKRRLKFLQMHQWAIEKSILPEANKAIIGIPEKVMVKQPIPGQISSFNELKLKQKLALSAVEQRPSLASLEQTIAPIIFNYQDILYCERNIKNAGMLRRLACLHTVNHILKTRDQVIKNNARLAREENDGTLELRDQGYTRPKVLMILPTRESCVRMVNMITSLCEPEQQENRKRFDESYVEREEKFSSDKPDDFRDLFAGNDDDMFRLGMKFTRKTIKYFSQFYNSDIILGSPLGLRMAIGNEDKKLDYDFLSSIEIVVVDQIEGLLMQNWDHMEFIFDHLNLQPKEAHGCDFSRVRSWCLDDNSKYFRQIIAFSAFNTPEINTLFYNQSKNWAGKIKINRSYGGAIQELGMKVKQTFSRLESPSFTTDPDTRFNYFTTAIVTFLVRHKKDTAGTLIFIPSYVDFVRVRNYFATSSTTSNLSFGCISEYTSVKEVSRARSHFLTGRHHVLLYTERAHHFRRYQLKGVERIIMYGLPDNPIFYKELVGGYLGKSIQEGLIGPGEGNVRTIFSKWDVLKLERIVGTERVGRMMKEKGDTFDFI